MNAHNLQAVMSGGMNTIENSTLRPTSSYLCSSCKVQLFTNIDILIHEGAVSNTTNVDDTNAKRGGGVHSKSRQNNT